MGPCGDGLCRCNHSPRCRRKLPYSSVGGLSFEVHLPSCNTDPFGIRGTQELEAGGINHGVPTPNLLRQRILLHLGFNRTVFQCQRDLCHPWPCIQPIKYRVHRKDGVDGEDTAEEICAFPQLRQTGSLAGGSRGNRLDAQLPNIQTVPTIQDILSRLDFRLENSCIESGGNTD